MTLVEVRSRRTCDIARQTLCRGIAVTQEIQATVFRPDDKLGPYALVRALGRGAFGEVWLAEKRSALLTTQAALKMPLVAESDVEAVRGEAALWLQASGHPNIVPVLDADVYDGQIVIASEYIAGGSLYEWMQGNHGKAPSVEAAVTITVGILAGLDYLHRVGLTHRDLKPENVLLQDGIPRLTDFGLAQVVRTEAQTGNILGTPRYMAPETFSGSYSPSSDLWAVGVILQELLTGIHPFPTQELMGLIIAIQSQEPQALADSIPERLRSIVTRLLAKTPSDRFASASAAREALQNCRNPLAGVPIVVENGAGLARHNFPAQPTTFIGREKEIADLKGLLERTRLLTLTGSGGCGKTRLSLEVAERVLEQFPNGAWLVELAHLADGGLVPQTVADVLRVPVAPGEPISGSLLVNLKDRGLLLVLDNCEHVLEAVAHLADSLLHSCPRVKILVSSQEALGIAGECAYRVPSLSLPGTNQSLSLESLSQYDAVRLFIERAMAVKTDFAVTEQNAAALASVCQSLDGIPLAIELAAARVRSMTVDEVRRRLDDRFLLLTGGSRTALARQRTLLAAIQWSYDLLEEKQRAVLCRLSVFAGGWTLDASEQVCRGDNIEEWEVLDLLTALVDKSLVVAEEQEPGQTRYRILETVRQYARDRLMESGESEGIRERHQAFFAALAEATEPKLHGPEQAATLNCLESEHDNLRAALKCQGTSARLRLAASLWWFWYLRGYLSEGRSILAEVLKESIDFGHTPARAKALHGAGILAEGQFDLEPAQLYYAESLAIYRELGDNRGAADSLNIQGFVAGAQGNHRKARELFEQSLLLGRELGDKWLIGNSLNGLGSVTAAQGEYAKAQTLYEESTTLFRNLGAKWGVAWSLQSSGNMALSLGDFALAKTYLEQSLAIMRELGNERGVADTLYGLGVVARYNGDYLAASVHYEHSLVLRRKLEDTQGIAASLLGLGHTTQISGDYAAAAKMYRESLSILRTSVDALGIANSFEAFAALASEQENTLRGVLLWGAAEAIREEIRSPMPASIRPRYVRQVSEARGCLTEHAFAAAWTEGREMSMEQAIEFALEVSKV